MTTRTPDAITAAPSAPGEVSELDFVLTEEQQTIMELVAHGDTDAQIAERMTRQLGKHISVGTIANRMDDIRKLLHARNRTHAVYQVYTLRLAAPDTIPVDRHVLIEMVAALREAAADAPTAADSARDVLARMRRRSADPATEKE